MTPNYAICQGETRMEIPTCQSQMNAISFRPWEIFNTSNEGETRRTEIRRWFICNRVAPAWQNEQRWQKSGSTTGVLLVDCHTDGQRKWMKMIDSEQMQSQKQWRLPVTLLESASLCNVEIDWDCQGPRLCTQTLLFIAQSWTNQLHLWSSWLLKLHWIDFFLILQSYNLGLLCHSHHVAATWRFTKHTCRISENIIHSIKRENWDSGSSWCQNWTGCVCFYILNAVSPKKLKLVHCWSSIIYFLMKCTVSRIIRLQVNKCTNSI